MLIGKRLSILIIVIYTILSNIIGFYLKIHWLHVFNSLILVNILYHLLEWKFDWVEETKEEEAE